MTQPERRLRRELLGDDARTFGAAGTIVRLAARLTGMPIGMPVLVDLAALARIAAADAASARHLAHALAAARQSKAEAAASAASEARLRAAIDSLPDNFWVTDQESRYVEQNAVDRAAFGDLTELRAHQVEPPLEQAEQWQSQHEQVLAGETLHFNTVRRQPQSGEELFMEILMSPLVHDGDIIGMVGLTIDRTVQEAAEQRLRQSEARLKATVESLPCPLFVCDLDGRHVLQNNVDRTLWGDCLGKTYAELDLAPEIMAEVPRILKRVRRSETLRSQVGYQQDGARREIEEIYAPIHEGEEFTGFVGLAVDRTDRIVAERRLKQSEARLADYLATASDWLWEADVEHQFMVLEGRESVGGLRVEEVVGKTPWAAIGVDPAEHPDWRHHLGILAAHRPFRNFVFEFAYAEGGTYWTERRACPRSLRGIS